MITNPFDLQKIPPPFGANGRHGGGGGDGGGGTGGGTGGGGGACCVRGILRKEQPVSPNFASGNVIRKKRLMETGIKQRGFGLSTKDCIPVINGCCQVPERIVITACQAICTNVLNAN